MSARLDQLEKDLRGAVVRRCYAEVHTIAAELCAQAAEEWRALPADAPRARLVFDRLQTSLEWARQMVCVSRAAAADELRRGMLTKRYLVPASAAGSRLRFDL
ncbi:MAG: hypothetical protein ABSF64_15220 [Bryobacteraceae bacterium]|jgi:hypothetical protein